MKLRKPLIHPGCVDDESPLGYLHRLVKLNDYSNIDWIVEDARISTFAEICDALFQNEWTGFSKNHPFDELAKMTYLYFKPSEILLCSLCLQENEYWNYEAHAVLSHICLKHKCWKQDSCASCKQKFRWRLGNLEYCMCGARRSTAIESPPNNVVELASFLQTKQPSQGAHSADYKSRCDLFMLFARSLNVDGRLPRLSPSIAREHWIRIADLLMGDIAIFKEFLKNLHERKPEDFKHFYRRFQDFDFEILNSRKEALMSFITRELKTPISKQHRSLVKDKPDTDIWMAIQTAARQFMVPKGMLEQLIQNGKLQHETRQRKRRLFTMIYIKSPIEFQAFVDKYINFQSASKLLGVTLAQLRTLVAHGYLKDVCKPDDDHLKWLISSEEIIGLKEKLLHKIKPSQDENIKICDALAHFSKGFEALLPEILTSILDGQITVVNSCEDKFLRDICLDREEFIAWRKQKLDDGKMSVVDLAKRLELNQESMYQIVNAGLIQSEECGKNGLNRQITEEQLDDFKNKYALLSKMSWALRKNSPRGFRAELEWYGVKPINQTLGLELRQVIYSRDELLQNCIHLGYMLERKGDWSFDKSKKISAINKMKIEEGPNSDDRHNALLDKKRNEEKQILDFLSMYRMLNSTKDDAQWSLENEEL